MRRFIPWFGAIAILVVVFGTIYGTVQHSQRRDANFPQVQLAEDTATTLNSGRNPGYLITSKVDPSTSLMPFIIIYNKQGRAISGSGYLHGHILTPPLGVLTAADDKPYHFVTWQPEPGVRIAAVTVAAKNYYVLSGRSLKEVEQSEQTSFYFALLGGLVSVAILGAAYFATQFRPKKL